MTEADLLMLQMEFLNFNLSILQVWLGSTTAMIAAAHFAARSLNLFFLSGMLSLYTVFSAYCSVQAVRTFARLQTIASDLLALERGGAVLSESSKLLVEHLNTQFVAKFGFPAAGCIFAGSVIYVLYCYRTGKRAGIV